MYVVPKVPLKYVLPGVMVHMFNGPTLHSMYDVLGLQHPYWIREAVKWEDVHIEDMLDDMYGSAREGELNMLMGDDDVSSHHRHPSACSALLRVLNRTYHLACLRYVHPPT